MYVARLVPPFSVLCANGRSEKPGRREILFEFCARSTRLIRVMDGTLTDTKMLTS
jgi:hypothetical protein